MADKKRKKKRLTKRERQLKLRLTFAGMGLCVVVLIGILLITLGKNSDKKENEEENKDNQSQIEGMVSPTPTSELTPTPEPTPAVSLTEIDSKSVILIRCKDGQIISELDADKTLYPASITKIMTAIVAIENISNLNETLKIKQSSYDKVYLEGASLAGMPCGEDIRIIDVLYGVMLPSGAECCLGIAEYLYGSEEAFAQKMNEKAAEIGMTSTHFVTCTGLHDNQHYTTVKDLAKLLQYALKNETFKQIYCSRTYTTSPMKKNADGLTFYNTMFSKMSNSTVNGGEILGGKTGFTSEAGYCLASYAMIHNEEYVLITAGSMAESKRGHIDDAFLIYNQIAQ